jgi:hypothetical protein
MLTPLMNASMRFVVGTSDLCAWCGQCDCGDIAPTEITVRGFAAGSTAPSFDTVISGPNAFSDPVLLADSSVLVAGLLPPDTATKLRDIDAQGHEVFACELPQPVTPGDTWSYSGAVALTHGGWAVLKQIGCIDCTHNPEPEVDVFSVPGLEEAPTGWTGQLGGPSRASRAH